MIDEALVGLWVSACSYGFLRRFPTGLTNGERAFKSGHSSVHCGAVLSQGQMKSLCRGWSVVTSVRNFNLKRSYKHGRDQFPDRSVSKCAVVCTHRDIHADCCAAGVLF